MTAGRDKPLVINNHCHPTIMAPFSASAEIADSKPRFPPAMVARDVRRRSVHDAFFTGDGWRSRPFGLAEVRRGDYPASVTSPSSYGWR